MGLFAKIFAAPGLSAAQQAEFEKEGLVQLAPAVSATKIFRHFRAPGRRASYDKRRTQADVVLTERRLVVLEARAPFIDCPWDDPRIQTIKATIDDGALLLVVDPSVFHHDWSGSIELHLRTERAETLLAEIQGRRG